MTRLRELVPYAALLAAALFLYAKTGAFAAVSRPGQLGPDAWPRAILALLVFVCVFEIARRSWSWRSARGEAAREAPGALPEGKRHPGLLVAGAAITILYVPAVGVLGFFLCTAAYLAAFMWIGRYRSVPVIAACSVLGSLAFVFVFMKIVYVSLPLGVGPFRVFSAWLLAALGIR